MRTAKSLASRIQLPARPLGTAILVAALAAPALAQANAGRVQFAYGNVQIVGQDGQARTARRGVQVLEGDTVRTPRGATAQLRMADGAAIAVRPNTAVRIDAYQYRGDAQKDRSFMSLLSGTLRSITGLIGRSNRNSYRVSTRTGTIGIRGSDADIGFNPDTGLMAVRTYSGGHSLTSTNASGAAVTLETNPGQIAIALPGQAPSFADSFPFATPAPRVVQQPRRQGPAAQGGAQEGQGQPNPDAREQAQGDGQGQQAQNGEGARRQQQARNRGARRVAAGTPPPGPGPGAQPPDGGVAVGPPPPPGEQRPISAGNTPLSLPTLAPNGTGAVGSFVGTPPGGSIVAKAGTTVVDNDSNIVLTGNLAPAAVTDPNAQGGFNFLANKAVLTGPVSFEIRNLQGATVASGNWGVWRGDFRVIDSGQQLANNSAFHFALSRDLTPKPALNALGAAGPQSFNFNAQIGGFATDQDGNFPIPGAANFSVQLAATFNSAPGNGNITAYNVTANFPSGNWSLGIGGPNPTPTIDDFIGVSGNPLTLTGSGPGGGAGGEAAGLFLGPGPTPAGVMSSFSAKDGSGKTVAGTAINRRTP